MDYGKFKYDKKKKSKKKPHVTKVKEVRFRPKTDEHDYEFKVRRAREFLGEGFRVIATVLFRGREMAFRDRGKTILARVEKDVADVARAEQAPRLEGRRFSLVLLPTKPAVKTAKSSERMPARKAKADDEEAPKESKEPAAPEATGDDASNPAPAGETGDGGAQA
jgi:translation initiation factor IF-3